jgi:hypothetical protein
MNRAFQDKLTATASLLLHFKERLGVTRKRVTQSSKLIESDAAYQKLLWFLYHDFQYDRADTRSAKIKKN